MDNESKSCSGSCRGWVASGIDCGQASHLSTPDGNTPLTDSFSRYGVCDKTLLRALRALGELVRCFQDNMRSSHFDLWRKSIITPALLGLSVLSANSSSSNSGVSRMVKRNNPRVDRYAKRGSLTIMLVFSTLSVSNSPEMVSS